MNYACVIVAAGLSSRMKNFKPLLQLGEQAVICHTVSHFADANIREIIVVTGFRGDELEAHLKEYAAAKTDFPSLHFVRNERFAETGMFDSYRLGLQAVIDQYMPDCDGVLLSPGDVPLVRPETVAAIRDCPAPMARPLCNGRRGHPVLLRKEVLPQIIAFDGDYGLRGAMEHTGMPISDVPVDDPWMLLDADTPEDFEILVSMLSGFKGDTV